ncbi:MAG TPA: AtpZ/AtpI family protein [Chitinophagaceae bacterium]|nr:AtpZ/AtpI family protein [Chitinophagaceae bacterium]
MNNKPPPGNNRDLLRYASMGTQMLVALGVSLFLGLKADQWFRLHFPLCIWLLPLLVLMGMFWQLARETSKKKNDGKQ